jgi:hypothetical protein
MTDAIESVAEPPPPRPTRRFDALVLLLVAIPLVVVLFELLLVPFFALTEFDEAPLRASFALGFLAVASFLCVRGCRAQSRPRVQFAARLCTVLLSLTAGLLALQLLWFVTVFVGVNTTSHDPEWGEPVAYAGAAIAALGIGAAGLRMALWPAARYRAVFLGSCGVLLLGLLYIGMDYLALVL